MGGGAPGAAAAAGGGAAGYDTYLGYEVNVDEALRRLRRVYGEGQEGGTREIIGRGGMKSEVYRPRFQRVPNSNYYNMLTGETVKAGGESLPEGVLEG